MFLCLTGIGPAITLIAKPAPSGQASQLSPSQQILNRKTNRLRAELRRDPQSAQLHNDLGVILGEAGNLKESIGEFETAVHLKKDYAQAYYNLAIARVKMAELARSEGESGNEGYYQNLDRAFTALQQADHLQPNLPNLHNLMGWLDEEVGDVPSAIQELEAAVKQQPNSADAYNNLGTALARQRDYVKAAGAYQKAVELDSHFVKAELNLESVAQRAWPREKLLGMRREAVQRHPSSALAHALLGHALLLNDQAAPAEAELRKALEVDPRLAIAQFYLGETLQRLVRLPASVDCLKAAVKLSPQTTDFLSGYGIALLRTRQIPEAIATLRQAIALDPNNASLHYVLATALQKAGKRALAAQQFQISTELNNRERKLEDAGLDVLNGIKDLRAGKVDAAVSNLQQAVARKPDDPYANYYLGIALAEKGDGRRAVAAFERALAERPQSAEIHYNFGIALWQMGDAMQALREFRQAVNLNPDDGLARCALGKALLREGLNADARSMLEQAQELGACRVGNTTGSAPH
ncbi:MAG: tetratricopeptide repeat protein [Acidobacteriota bacterium]|nr:tetratricopeptide repeat protein [Acidobacteriota bacterium]